MSGFDSTEAGCGGIDGSGYGSRGAAVRCRTPYMSWAEFSLSLSPSLSLASVAVADTRTK